MIKNVFHFIVKVLFVLKIFKFLFKDIVLKIFKLFWRYRKMGKGKLIRKLKAHRQISKKRCFEMYCSYDKIYQLSVL